MKKASVLIAILIVLTIPSIASAQARYITFTDSEGREQRHELAADGWVATRRPNETIEATIGYENGALRGVFTNRPDETTEALIGYENGALHSVYTVRPDGSAGRQITLRNGYPVCQ